MNQQDINQFLFELTPDAWDYLFPGMFSVVDRQLFKGLFPSSTSHSAPTIKEKRVSRRRAAAADQPMPHFVPNYFPAPSKETTADIFEPVEEAEAETPDTDADKLNARTELLLAEIQRLQEKYHVSIDELESLLGYTVKLSPLRILRSGKMYLSDYNNTEIRMPNVAKALFFLYLRHPEGLRFKDVADHKKELVELYGNITGRDNPDEIEKSIDLLADPFGNALNVNASRIKTAFRNAVSDRIARHYYINGAAGEIKKVPLNRDLVVWEQ